MLLLTAAEIRALTHIFVCAVVVAAKLAAGAAADGEADGRGLVLHLLLQKYRPGPLHMLKVKRVHTR